MFFWQRLVKYMVLLLITYCVVFAVGLFESDNLIYPIPAVSYKKLPTLFYLKTQNKNIAAIYLQNPKAEYTLLFSHGNGEDLGLIMPWLYLMKNHGFSVISYDYPGYGLSQGKPSEQNVTNSIMATYQYLVKQKHIPANKIIIYGFSLGTGPSVYLASHAKSAGLILQAPYVSLFRVLTHYKIFPLDQFDNLSRISKIKVPTLIIHGRADEVVPFWHGKTLFKALNSQKKSLWVDNAGHNNLVYLASDDYWNAIINFAKSLS